jgi:hypothetical protein
MQKEDLTGEADQGGAAGRLAGRLGNGGPLARELVVARRGRLTGCPLQVAHASPPVH